MTPYELKQTELCDLQYIIIYRQVKDQLKEYMFDPASIVLNICRIYIQLSDNEEFCAAVSRDGRSYSPHLFSQAEDVLSEWLDVLFLSCLPFLVIFYLPTTVLQLLDYFKVVDY